MYKILYSKQSKKSWFSCVKHTAFRIEGFCSVLLSGMSLDFFIRTVVVQWHSFYRKPLSICMFYYLCTLKLWTCWKHVKKSGDNIQYTPIVTQCSGSKEPYPDIKDSGNGRISGWPPHCGRLLYYHLGNEFYIIFLFSLTFIIYFYRIILYFNKLNIYLLFPLFGHKNVFYLLFNTSSWAIIQDDFIENTLGSKLKSCCNRIRVLMMHVILGVDCI